MQYSILMPLVFNAALLLAAAQLLDLLQSRDKRGHPAQLDWLMGGLLGVVCILVMTVPMTLRPGLVFDVRSVLIAITGLFFGVLPTLVTMTMAAAYRLSIGGVGTLMGISVILASGLLGLAWRRWRRPRLDAVGWTELWVLGLLVHGVMLALVVTLPRNIALRTLADIAAPVLLIYPLLTVAIGRLITGRLARLDVARALEESQARLQQAIRAGNIGLWDWDLSTDRVYFSPEWKRQIGYTDAEIGNRVDEWRSRLHPDDRNPTQEKVRHFIDTRQTDFTTEFRFRHRDGSYRWILARASMVFAETGRPLRMIGSHVDITEHKEAETALRESEFLFRSQFDLGNIGIAITSPQKGWLRVNPRLCGMLGYTETELKSMTWAEMTHPDDLAADEAQFARLLAGEIDGYEMDKRFYAKTGALVDTHLTVACYRERGQVKFIIASLLDIGERKRVAAALQQSEATIRNKLRAITEPGGDIGSLQLADIIDIDMLRPLMEDFYRLTGMLGAILDLSGEVLIAVGWQDICTKFHRCHPATRENCVESDTILTRGVKPGTFKAYRCKNHLWDMATPLMIGGRHVGNVFIGQFFYADETPDRELFRAQARQYEFDESAYLTALEQVPRFSREKVATGMRFYSELAGIISTLSFSAIQQSRMLTERRQAEAALQQAAMEWSQAMDFFADAVALVDLDDRIVRVNRAFTELAGLSADQAIGRDVVSVLHPRCEALPCRVCRARRERQDALVTLEANHPANQTGRPIDIMVRMIRNDAGEALNVLMGIHDLSSDREQQALQFANRHLRELDRLKSLFIASMSHELRTPLNTIIGFTGMIVDDMVGPVSELQRDYLQRVSRAGRHLLDLINDVIDVSKIEAGSLAVAYTDFDLGEVVEQAREQIAPRAQEKTLALHCEVPSDIVLHSDRKRLLQCLLNLLGNAVKYTDQGEIRLSATAADGRLTIDVRDTGIGIAAPDLDKLFQPFVRLDSPLKISAGGSGLGLYLTHKLAREVLGGEVEVESRIGAGSRFRLRLPLHRDAQADTPAPESHEDTAA